MKTLRSSTLIFLLLFSLQFSATAQLETTWWYFGFSGGLEFTTGAPLPATGGITNTNEGSSAVSDPVTGNLLFYSDGNSAYDASHTVMPNGGGLMGNSSSTQSALIVPQPGTTNMFYLFTTDCIENSGLNGARYSVIDMTLNGGMGDITAAKNVALFPGPCSEQLAAIKHANCIDWWIMTKEMNNNVYHAYLLTATGLTGPVTTAIGIGIGSSPYGQGKFTPDGTKFAIATGGAGAARCQLFDFDNTTGVLSNAITVANISGQDAYGMCFSGDNTKLYMMRGGSATDLYQYDISSGVAATIIASATFIGTNSYYNQMQLALDGKIYVAASMGGNFSVINNPNVSGVGCGFSVNTIPIGGSSFLGVCNFPDSYFNEVNPCATTFSIYANGNNISCNGANDGMAWVNIFGEVDNISWSPGGSTNDTITNLGPGVYVVTVTDTAGTVLVDSVTITEPLVLATNVSASEDTVCAGTAVNFSSVTTGGTTSYSYQWSTAASDTSSGNIENMSSSGYVSLDVTDANGCNMSDSVYVTVLPIPIISASGDTCVCLGGNVTLTASGTPSFNWSTGDTTATINLTPAGNMTVYVSYSNGSCMTIDSVIICVYPVPSVSITGNDSICSGMNVSLTSTVTGGTSPFSIDWSGLATGSGSTISFNPLAAGTMNVLVADDNGCTDTASTFITVFPSPNLVTSADTCICFGESATLTATGAASYSWSTGETTSTITVTPSNSTVYIVSHDNGVCNDSDTVSVCVFPLPDLTVSNDTTIQAGDTVQLMASGIGAIEWGPPSGLSCTECPNPIATPMETTTYTAWITSAFGCVALEEVTITVDYTILIPNIITPNQDGLNDVFFIKGMPPGDHSLSIFNRWGNVLYTTNAYRNDWAAGSDGVYYYIFRTEEGVIYTGFFHIADKK